MVTIGFIVEGDSEAILLKHESFIGFLQGMNLYCNKELVINAGGKSYLYHPTGDFSQIEARAKGWIETLASKGANTVFILLDFDNSDADLTAFKQKVYHQQDNIIIIAKQALEAWYLADGDALNNYLSTEGISVEHPENFLPPLDEIKRLKLHHLAKGVSDKKILTRHFINCGFSINSAANHGNCPSAQYFLEQLQNISKVKQ